MVWSGEAIIWIASWVDFKLRAAQKISKAARPPNLAVACATWFHSSVSFVCPVFVICHSQAHV
jgi:hypothetical protein